MTIRSCVSISGDMDAAGCQNIQSTIDDVVSKPHPHIDVDMENVAFLDSSRDWGFSLSL